MMLIPSRYFFLYIFLIDFFAFVQLIQYFDDDLTKDYGKIIQVSALIRHGERTPYQLYPTDPYRKYQWPDGIAQLTLTGKKASYRMGKWFRDRYADLFSTIHFPSQIRVDSSDLNRCLMTAQCFLAGFYPPLDSQKIESKLLWQPIPVHTRPAEMDNILALEAPCRVWSTTVEQFFKTDKEIDASYRKHKDTLDYIVQHSKIKCDRNHLFNCSWELYKLYDALHIEKDYNFELPNWTRSIYPEPLYTIMMSFLFKEMPLMKIRRLTAGPFLQVLTSGISDKISRDGTTAFHIYVAHDNTLAAIMAALDISNGCKMPYNAAMFFELREKAKGKYFITIQLFNSTIFSSTTTHSTMQGPYLMQIPKCNKACNLTEFFDITRPFIPSDWTKECNNKT